MERAEHLVVLDVKGSCILKVQAKGLHLRRLDDLLGSHSSELLVLVVRGG